MLQQISDWAKRIKQQVLLLWTAYQHPECPAYVKVLIGLIVLYALSPLDLIPDFIPVFGQLDDILILGYLIKAANKEIERFMAWESQQSTANL